VRACCSSLIPAGSSQPFAIGSFTSGKIKKDAAARHRRADIGKENKCSMPQALSF